MSQHFSPAELAYLAEPKLGRLSTIDRRGRPHVVPVGWSYNEALDTIEVSGHDFARTAKFRNAQRQPAVALVIDDVLPPWQPRAIMVQGTAEALEDVPTQHTEAGGALLRITPERVVSWGLDAQPTG